jgi:hypothetical protein
MLAAVFMTDCTDTLFERNRLTDIGRTGTSYTIVTLFGASSNRNIFRFNTILQTTDTYAKNGIFEDTGVDGTIAESNDFTCIGGLFTKPYTKVGANSVMRRVEFLSAAPASTYHNVGDITWNTGVAAAGSPGWICTTAGSPGTFKAMAAVAA